MSPISTELLMFLAQANLGAQPTIPISEVVDEAHAVVQVNFRDSDGALGGDNNLGCNEGCNNGICA
jgi:hypothetical protein